MAARQAADAEAEVLGVRGSGLVDPPPEEASPLADGAVISAIIGERLASYSGGIGRGFRARPLKWCMIRTT